MKARAGYRICNVCREEKAASPEHFARDKTRPLGLGYQCKECMRKISRQRGDARVGTGRYKQLSPEQKAHRKAAFQARAKTPRGRAEMLRNAYRKNDECDLTVDEVMAIVALPCTYCGTVDMPRGLDRLDNSLGHVRGNVQSACRGCNTARGARLSVEDMKAVVTKVVEKMIANGHIKPSL